MPDNNYEMKIVFAGDAIIRVISEVIEVTLDDQGDAWDTKICLNTENYEFEIIFFNQKII